MSYRELNGNLFASSADALVNTVNCVGPMGKGIALEFRRRFPEMFAVYKETCEKGLLRPGQILPYRKSSPWVLNFAVKDDWKHPSRVEWVEQCLEKFCQWYPTVGLRSVAFPWMGAMNGRIPLEQIQQVTRHYLSNLPDLDVEVYSFDPKSSDPLFDTLSRLNASLTSVEFQRQSGIRIGQVEELYKLLGQTSTISLTPVVESGLLGKTSLDRLYQFLVVASRDEQLATVKVPLVQQLDLL